MAGKVYRGILSNGQDVAIKHIINEGHTDTYVREVASLSDVRHPNLVALLGYCENEDECFLVYELCRNGNLSEWLFGTNRYPVLFICSASYHLNHLDHLLRWCEPQEKIKYSRGSKDSKSPSTAQGDSGFSTPIQKAVLFTVILKCVSEFTQRMLLL